jgi:hypothetical protein
MGGGTMPRLVIHPDAPAHGIHHVFDDGKAEPRALVATRGLSGEPCKPPLSCLTGTFRPLSSAR